MFMLKARLIYKGEHAEGILIYGGSRFLLCLVIHHVALIICMRGVLLTRCSLVAGYMGALMFGATAGFNGTFHQMCKIHLQLSFPTCIYLLQLYLFLGVRRNP